MAKDGWRSMSAANRFGKSGVNSVNFEREMMNYEQLGRFSRDLPDLR